MRNTDNEIDSERVSPDPNRDSDIDIESFKDNKKVSASPSSAQNKKQRQDRKPKSKKNFKEEENW